MTNQEIIDVVRAHQEGKEIWYQEKGTDEWDRVTDPSWNFDEFNYKATEPPREFWINVYPNRCIAHKSQHEASSNRSPGWMNTIHVKEVR